MRRAIEKGPAKLWDVQRTIDGVRYHNPKTKHVTFVEDADDIDTPVDYDALCKRLK